jgi:hypothetical protein
MPDQIPQRALKALKYSNNPMFVLWRFTYEAYVPLTQVIAVMPEDLTHVLQRPAEPARVKLTWMVRSQVLSKILDT